MENTPSILPVIVSIVSGLFTIVVGLICYMWVRLQRQIDKQQNITAAHDTTLAGLVKEKEGEYKLLVEKLSQQFVQITEMKSDVKELTKTVHEVKGSMQNQNQNTHHENRS